MSNGSSNVASSACVVDTHSHFVHILLDCRLCIHYNSRFALFIVCCLQTACFVCNLYAYLSDKYCYFLMMYRYIQADQMLSFTFQHDVYLTHKQDVIEYSVSVCLIS